MKNKEIEELLNNFQEVLDNPTTTDEYYDGRIIEIDRSYDLEQDEIKLLLSYIEQIEDKINWYENIDINKTIDKFRVEHNEEIKELHNKIEQLENNRDKAIEEIKYLISNCDIVDYQGEKIMNILKGDSDGNL